MSSTTDLNQFGDARDVVGENFGFLFAKMHHRCARISVDVLRDAGLGLSGMHVGVMAMIQSRGPMSQHAVGEALGKDRTTMVSVVDELEREGLVERRRNPADRRAYALEVSDEGRRWLTKAQAQLSSMEAKLLAGLDEDDRDVLRAMLQRVVFDTQTPE